MQSGCLVKTQTTIALWKWFLCSATPKSSLPHSFKWLVKQITKSIATKLSLIFAIKTLRQNPSITCSWQSQGWLQPACFICLNTSFPCSRCKGIFPTHIPFNLLEWVLYKCLTFICTDPCIPQLSEHTLITGIGNRLGLSKGTDLAEMCQSHVSASHGGNTHCSGGRAWPRVILQLCVTVIHEKKLHPCGNVQGQEQMW